MEKEIASEIPTRFDEIEQILTKRRLFSKKTKAVELKPVGKYAGARGVG